MINMSSNGDIDKCPNCSFTMRKGNAPFKFHGSYVGKFEAYICGKCDRTYFTESAYKDIMGMPLNRDEAINFSEEVKMPPVTVVSPVITYRLRRAPSVNVKSKVNELDTFVLGSEESSEHKMTNTQSYDLEVVA